MKENRSFCASLCPCLFPVKDHVENKPEQQVIDLPQPPVQEVAPPEKVLLNVKREFELNLSQISSIVERNTQDDIDKYKYNCPICTLFFNKMLTKKIEDRCWWCKTDQCVIVIVEDTEIIKNYSDAAAAQEEKKNNENQLKQQQQQQLELIRSAIFQKLSMRQSLAHSKNQQNKSNFQVDNNNNNMTMANPLMIDTIKSEYLPPFGRRTFQNQEEERKEVNNGGELQQVNYNKKFAQTDSAAVAMMRAVQNVQNNQQIDGNDNDQGYNQQLSKSLVENNNNNNNQQNSKLHSSICVQDWQGQHVPIAKARNKMLFDKQFKENSNSNKNNNNMYGNIIGQNDDEEEEQKIMGNNQQQGGYFYNDNQQQNKMNNTAGNNKNINHNYQVSEIREQEEASQVTFTHVEASQMNKNNNFSSYVNHNQINDNNNGVAGHGRDGHVCGGSVCVSDDINDRV